MHTYQVRDVQIHSEKWYLQQDSNLVEFKFGNLVNLCFIFNILVWEAEFLSSRQEGDEDSKVCATCGICLRTETVGESTKDCPDPDEIKVWAKWDCYVLKKWGESNADSTSNFGDSYHNCWFEHLGPVFWFECRHKETSITTPFVIGFDGKQKKSKASC